MIISASRRTDIPAFFSEWFMNRIREKYCCTFNPFNRNQISRISLAPEDVEVIVFWTKNAEPLVKYLAEIDESGYKYFFQYTITGYSKHLEPNTPSLQRSIESFIKLSEKISPAKIIWRYDPIIFSNITDYEYHYKNFTGLAEKLKGKTKRAIISIVDDYRGAKSRLAGLNKLGFGFLDKPTENLDFRTLILEMNAFAKRQGIEVYSCAEPVDMRDMGVLPGKCIDDAYIRDVFNIDVSKTKDKGQRTECGCVVSRDIGIYDTCLHGCRYCYANRSDKLVLENVKMHNKESDVLIGDNKEEPMVEKKKNIEQLRFHDI